MIDKFKNFISTDIYVFEEMEIDDISEFTNAPSKPKTIIRLELSKDHFNHFCDRINKNNIDNEIDAIIYDEGIIRDSYDRYTRQRLIKKLNKLNFRNINFVLSNDTLPIYNHFMNIFKWRHGSKTTISMKIDRRPISEEIRTWNLSSAVGRLNLPEEKLIWVPDNDLKRIQGKIDEKVLQDTLKLKNILISIDKYLKENYYIEKMNDYEKVYLIYNLIKTQISFPHKYTKIVNGKMILTEDQPSYISEPYGTWINKEGVCEGQARLMVSLLNNPFMKIDATTIYGEVPQGMHTWVGIVIQNELYQCCTTMKGPFRNLDQMGYRIEKEQYDNQMYPDIYKHAYLSEEEINKIKRRVKSLKK